MARTHYAKQKNLSLHHLTHTNRLNFAGFRIPNSGCLFTVRQRVQESRQQPNLRCHQAAEFATTGGR